MISSTNTLSVMMATMMKTIDDPLLCKIEVTHTPSHVYLHTPSHTSYTPSYILYLVYFAKHVAHTLSCIVYIHPLIPY